MNAIRLIIVLLLTVIILLPLLVLFDLANYDSSYVNRNSLTFSINNLNSKKTKKLFRYYNNFYNEVGFKIFKEHREYWKVEEMSLRADLPEIKIISEKKGNFLPGKKSSFFFEITFIFGKSILEFESSGFQYFL